MSSFYRDIKWDLKDMQINFDNNHDDVFIEINNEKILISRVAAANKMFAAIESAIVAASKYKDHPMTASEVILRDAYKSAGGRL